MTVKTKFSIGQKVYVMHEGKIGSFFVDRISVAATKDYTDIRYGFYDQVGDYCSAYETNVFASEQQLIKQLLKQYKEDYQ